MTGMTLAWGLIAVIGVPLVLWGYVALAERVIMKAGPRRRAKIRPWLWLFPAFFLLAAFLIYPAVYTFVLGFFNASSTKLIGLANYIYIFTQHSMLIVLRNNLLWLVILPLATITLGLIVAVLSDRVRYESAIKALIFLPMAISFVAAGVIWRFMYTYEPAGTPQIGTVNAMMIALNPHFAPQAWLFNTNENNWALIVVGVWMWTGFAMVILSAGLKGIPDTLLEAARIDGANELQVFFRVTVPLLAPTMTVVATTLIINVLKIFDIVYVMTSGNLGTNVIANEMYKQMFIYQDSGKASALAVLLLLAIIPVMVLNIKRFGRTGSSI